MFLVQAHIPGYAYSNLHKLAVLMLVDGQHWRAHLKTVHHYVDGAFGETDILDVNPWRELCALEGVFVTLAEQHQDLEWKWVAVQPVLQPLLTSVTGGCYDHFVQHAKTKSDELRKATSGRASEPYMAVFGCVFLVLPLPPPFTSQ
jgi:hypothetical protein